FPRRPPAARPRSLDLRRLQPDARVFGDLTDVALPQLFQAADEVRVPAIDLVEGHPAVADLLPTGQEQFKGQLGLGAKDDPFGHAGPAAALGVFGPGVGQVQARIEQGVAGGTGVGDIDGHLAVVDLAGGAAVLAGDADALGAALGEAALVQDEDAVGAAEFGIDLAEQLPAEGSIFPGGL